MSENHSVLGAGPQEGLSPLKVLRRKNGRFSPYRFATRRLSLLSALKSLYGDGHHSILFTYSAAKISPRHARNLNVDIAS